MVSRPRIITGTPFSSTNFRIIKRTNMKIKNLIRMNNITKKQIALRNLKDKIDSRKLPPARPGAIE